MVESEMRPGRGRATAIAAAASAGLVIAVLVACDAHGSSARYDDNVAAFGPLMKTNARLWREGSPFWDPYVHFGEPTLPQLGSGPLYPPALLLGALAPLEDVGQAWVVLHAVLAAAGAAFLARTLGTSGTAAALAGVANGLGGPHLYLAKTWMPMGLGGAWTPWFLAFVLRAGAGSRAAAGLAALSLALEVHAGAVEPACHAVVLGVVLLAVSRPVSWLAIGAFVLGAAMASPIVLETLGVLGGSNRDAFHTAAGVELTPAMIAGVVSPGLPAPNGIPWNPGFAPATPLFQGFVPHLVLAATFSWRLADRRARALAVAGLVALFLALGTSTGASAIWDRLPALRSVHHPIGRACVIGLVVSILAASGADRLAGLSRARLAAAAGALVGMALAAALVLSGAGGRSFSEAVSPWALRLGALAVAAAVGLVLSPPRWRARVALAATVVLLAVQLANLWIGVSAYDPKPRGPVAEVAAAARASGGRVAPVLAWRELIALPMRASLARDEGGVEGFPSAAGYSIVYPRETKTLWGYEHMSEVQEDRFRALLAGSALEAGGIRFVHGSGLLVRLIHETPRAERFLERWRTPATITFENLAWRGRAYRVGRAEGAALVASDLERPDLLDVALVESGSPLAGRTFERGLVTSFEETPGRIKVGLEPRPAPSLLVVTTSEAPGWSARVDGRAAPTHRVQGALLGVEVPAGGELVELRYFGWRLGLGLGLGAAGLLGAVACVARGLRVESFRI